MPVAEMTRNGSRNINPSALEQPDHNEDSDANDDNQNS